MFFLWLDSGSSGLAAVTHLWRITVDKQLWAAEKHMVEVVLH